ncbi:hypothetical protein [Halobaculum rubrum]|uniref:hypothetical protein n=1 Tax=Halobaculum rubrum TaxID=2872158 RepID=UPI001CA427F4|nr:hypothetical protein [Halobaculum rubrum]QZY01175.1 hypothetical protein K6T25_15410 [Halobaculum rubrum]
MDPLDSLEKMLNRKLGYEIMYKLLESDSSRVRRSELVRHSGAKSETVRVWLNDAEEAGIVKNNKYHNSDGEEISEYESLVSIVGERREVLRSRGSEPRDVNGQHTDRTGISAWDDGHRSSGSGKK